MTTRRQLTLFLSMPGKGIVDQVRQRADPVQFAKIPAHITLCYDDEIQDWDYVTACLEAFATEDIRFSFTVDGARVFEAEGKGIYLHITDQSGFYDLARSRLLATSSSVRRQVRPHLTLLHPRHARDSTDGWTLVDSIDFPERLSIQQISLIELRASKWTVVHTYGKKEPNQSLQPTGLLARG
jgi:2'-5' RNA ligase